jgi:hypothetical protein
MMVFDRIMVVTLPELELLDSEALLNDELVAVVAVVAVEVVEAVEAVEVVEVLDGCPPRRSEMMAPRSGPDGDVVELLVVVAGAVVTLLEVELIVELESKPNRSRLIL